MEKYDPRWALITDFYQLTMAAGYVKAGKAKETATFNLLFRRVPENGAFCLTAGLERIVAYLLNIHFTSKQIDYLHKVETFRKKDIDGKNFDDFFDYLKTFHFTGTVQGVPEGKIIFPHEPILSITAPLAEAQIIETFLLQTFNFQTRIATKAVRIVMAAQGDPVIEFGARRAFGPDGALSASRAAYIGGCSCTSNVLAGYEYGIPIAGTHAHSWIMSFDNELESFEKYALTFPENSVLLLDTTNTMNSGVPNAIKTAIMLKEKGYEIQGIRLDSGDLLDLSVKVLKEFKKAGFPNIMIVASGDLDEYEIVKLKEAGAKINAWGVGTKLVAPSPDSALGGVYKLAEIEGIPKIKIAGEKTTNPGKQSIWRTCDQNLSPAGDIVALNDEIIPGFCYYLLTKNIIKDGKLISPLPSLEEIRMYAAENLMYLLRSKYSLFENPPLYPVKLSPKLAKLKKELIDQSKNELTQ